MNSMMQKQFFFYLLLMRSIWVFSQFYSTGQAPDSVKWEQINTDKFQIIYPVGFYDEANRVANILDYMYEYIAADYSKPAIKVSIILHNRSVISNGYVSWAPKRSEWITTPPQDNYAHDWLEQLALHEFRHVVQMSNLKQGITKILTFLFGEAAVGAVAGYLPLWFYEGDAVLAETVLSSTGRGRQPDFDKELRAIELEQGKRFSYDQSYLGSYKYYVPNYYKYGFQMVSYAKVKYDSSIWNTTLSTTAKWPVLAAPFLIGLNRSGAGSKNTLYHNTFDSLNTLWNKNLRLLKFTNTSTINTNHRSNYSQYKYVQDFKNGYFAVRSSLDDVTRFVYLNGEDEEILLTPGFYYNTPVDAGNKYICWEELNPDTRWDQQSFSEIYIYSVERKRKWRLTKKTRLFSPSLSPDEEKLICLQVDLNNAYSILVLSVPAGQIVNRINISEYGQVFSPVWLNSNEIAFIGLDSEGKKIVRYNLQNKQSLVLFNAGYTDIRHLSYAGDAIYFTSDFTQSANIYKIDLNNLKVVKLTTAKYAADFGSCSSDKNLLVFSDYTIAGYRPVTVNLDSLGHEELHLIKEKTYPWLDELNNVKSINIQEKNLPEKEYTAKPYRKWFHGFNLHSWAPFYFDPSQAVDLNTPIYPGLTLLSQNKLSTLTTQLSYYYRDGDHYIVPKIIYEGLFPVFELDVQVTTTSRYYKWPRGISAPENPDFYRRFSLRTYLPFNLSRGGWHRFVRPQLNFSYLHAYYVSDDEVNIGLNYVDLSFFAYNLRKQSYKNIQPRFGQRIFLAYNKPLKNNKFFASAWFISFDQYLPGVARHHSWLLRFAFEVREKEKNEMVLNRNSLPRGYEEDFSVFRSTKLSSEYGLPLLYPDLSLGPLLYIKRITISGYIDAAKIHFWEDYKNTRRTNSDLIYSYGLILGGEVHFLRFFMPFLPRLRISYLPLEHKMDYGFDININTAAF